MECLSFFEWAEVFALEVFDQRDFEEFAVVDIPDDDRNLVEFKPYGRLVASLPCYDLKTSAPLPDNQRFNNAFFNETTSNNSHKL